MKAAQEGDVARRIWNKDATLWAPEGTPEVADRLGWLTVTDAMAEQLSRPRGLRRRGPRRGHHRRRPAGHGRLVAGPRGHPPVLRRPGRVAHAARPGLHRRRRHRRRRRQGRPRAHAVPGVDEVRRHDRDAVAVQALLVAALGGLGLRGDHRPGLGPGRPGQGARLPPHVPQRPRHRRALQRAVVLRPRARGADGRQRRRPARPRRRSRARSRRPSTRSATGSGWASPGASSPWPAATSSPTSSTRRWSPSASGSSSSSRSRRARRARASCRWPASRSASADAYGDDRVFLHLRNADEPDEAHDEAIEALKGAGHPVIVRDIHGPDDLGRIFFFAEFAIAAAGWVLGINPFDQPNVQEAKDATKQVLDSGTEDQDDAGDAELKALLGQARGAALPRGDGLPRAVGGARRGRRGAARRDPRRDALGDDVRLRAALPALHRPAAQGRAGRGRVPAAAARRRARRRHPRRRLRASRGSSTRRRSATWRRCARTTCRPSGSRSPATTRRQRCASSPSA